MSIRHTITISDECNAAIKKLCALETRSISNCIAAIIERNFSELRDEWRDTGAVETLRKPKRSHKRDNRDIENMPL
jgi:predicted CopG family antitoxin